MATLILTAATKLIASAGVGTILQGAGAAIGAIGSIKAGKSQQAAANYQAAQLDAAAKTESASAQRVAQEERRQKELVLSRARAVGAASGGGQDIGLLGAIEEDGELRALTALWEGDEAAKGRRAQASASRFEGKQMAQAGKINAFTTVLSSAGKSFSEKYS